MALFYHSKHKSMCNKKHPAGPRAHPCAHKGPDGFIVRLRRLPCAEYAAALGEQRVAVRGVVRHLECVLVRPNRPTRRDVVVPEDVRVHPPRVVVEQPGVQLAAVICGVCPARVVYAPSVDVPVPSGQHRRPGTLWVPVRQTMQLLARPDDPAAVRSRLAHPGRAGECPLRVLVEEPHLHLHLHNVRVVRCWRRRRSDRRRRCGSRRSRRRGRCRRRRRRRAWARCWRRRRSDRRRWRRHRAPRQVDAHRVGLGPLIVGVPGELRLELLRADRHVDDVVDDTLAEAVGVQRLRLALPLPVVRLIAECDGNSGVGREVLELTMDSHCQRVARVGAVAWRDERDGASVRQRVWRQRKEHRGREDAPTNAALEPIGHGWSSLQRIETMGRRLP
jgi:hypothetical protein